MFGGKTSRLIHQFSAESGQMADIVIASQGIRGIIRLEMSKGRILQRALKGTLIRIDKVGVLFLDYLHHLEQGGRMKQIVMIKQADIFTRSHLNSRICIGGNPQVFG